jgi:hypothetical protein
MECYTHHIMKGQKAAQGLYLKAPGRRREIRKARKRQEEIVG